MRILAPILLGLVVASAALQAQPVALSVNPGSREEVRQFFRAVYQASENVPLNWTGSYATGAAGDTSPAFKEATRLRINFFRALAGLPAGVTFNPTFTAKSQEAAFMMSANNTLDHFPPASWIFYTAAGAEAAANSNLYIGAAGPAAISGYIADAGDNNRGVGHRRWLFYPQTRQMGTGDVPGIAGDTTRVAANAVWVVDTGAGQFGSPRPTTRQPAIAYPPAGYVPYPIVWPRWSFSLPAADFSAAGVTVTRNGQPVPVALEPISASSAGEPTLVWVVDGLDSRVDTPHVRPAADVTYTVAVNNVRIAGASQNFNYTVTVFDPNVPGADASLTAVTGPATPAVGTPNGYSVAKPAFVAAMDWRTLQLTPFNKTFTAEAGLDGLLATTSAGYNVVQTASVAAGSAAYRLAHVNPRSTQVLQLPETYHVGGADSAITFRSRLGIATAIETARVEISTDEGLSWIELFAQRGTSAPNTSQPQATDNGFVARSISLGAYAGRTVQVRLAYTIELSGIAFLPDPTNGVGWFIDDLSVVNVQIAAPNSPTRVANGSTFSFSPATAGAVALQARGVLFGAYPLEWGPALPVVAIDGNANNDPGRLINMSIRTNAGTGDNTLIVGVGIGGANTSGTKAVLLRAVGPTLGAFGVGGALSDSIMSVFQGSTAIAQNDDWAGGFNFGSVGAFDFASPVRDAAIYNPTIARDSYSIQIAGKNNATGIALAEIYDATPRAAFTASTPRLVNVSARTEVGTGDNILIAGFVVGGSSPVRVLVRAVGPTLGAFGVGGVLADPRLEILSGPIRVAENDNWSAGDSPLFRTVGAFDLNPSSRDAAVVVTLQPGNYTAQVTGVNNTTGVALIEVYEVP